MSDIDLKQAMANALEAIKASLQPNNGRPPDVDGALKMAKKAEKLLTKASPAPRALFESAQRAEELLSCITDVPCELALMQDSVLRQLRDAIAQTSGER